jgi:hypothetical protein
VKAITVPILIFLITTQAFSKWVVLLQFNWNHEYIAANLCVNKARPQSKCRGNCQLMKKIAEGENENNSSQNGAGKLTFQEVLFTIHVESISVPVLMSENNSFFTGRQNWKAYSPPCSVFHPPLV